MNPEKLALILTASGSALCWWPVLIEPGLGVPLWLPLALVGLMTGLSTALAGGSWFRLVVASVIGSFAGLCIGWFLFPSADELANAYRWLMFVVLTLATFGVSLAAGLIGRRVQASKESQRRVVWLAALACAAFGPAALAVTRPIVANRNARNDRLAAERFKSLKLAAERTKAQGARGHICDIEALRSYYLGPQFNNEDWRRIAANFVQQDGYFFMVKCRETVGYTITATPAELSEKAKNKDQFCSDQCSAWLRSQHLCSACTE